MAIEVVCRKLAQKAGEELKAAVAEARTVVEQRRITAVGIAPLEPADQCLPMCQQLHVLKTGGREMPPGTGPKSPTDLRPLDKPFANTEQRNRWSPSGEASFLKQKSENLQADNMDFQQSMDLLLASMGLQGATPSKAHESQTNLQTKTQTTKQKAVSQSPTKEKSSRKTCTEGETTSLTRFGLINRLPTLP